MARVWSLLLLPLKNFESYERVTVRCRCALRCSRHLASPSCREWGYWLLSRQWSLSRGLRRRHPRNLSELLDCELSRITCMSHFNPNSLFSQHQVWRIIHIESHFFDPTLSEYLFQIYLWNWNRKQREEDSSWEITQIPDRQWSISTTIGWSDRLATWHQGSWKWSSVLAYGKMHHQRSESIELLRVFRQIYAGPSTRNT